jgi:hypothetical protein
MMAIADDLAKAQTKTTPKQSYLGALAEESSGISGEVAAQVAETALAAKEAASLGQQATAMTVNRKAIGTYTDPTTGDVIERYDNGTEEIIRKGTIQQDKTTAANLEAEAKRRQGQSAYDLLYSELNQNGLGSLLEPLKNLIVSGASKEEFTMKLRETPQYQQRFGANKQRIAKGLAAINEAEYIALEDQYQNVMRNYGLPESYWAKDSMGTQEGFTQLIANDVDATELEDRIILGKTRVLNANPRVKQALQQFYPDINDGDILGFVLDPTKGMDLIKRKVTAAEIGGAQLGAGLNATMTNAEALAANNVTGAQYQAQASNIAGGSLRGGQLASFYGQDPYTQQTAEQVALNIPGSAEAIKQTQKITGLEKASFNARTGLTGTALARDRAGGY